LKFKHEDTRKHQRETGRQCLRQSENVEKKHRNISALLLPIPKKRYILKIFKTSVNHSSGNLLIPNWAVLKPKFNRTMVSIELA